jgi:hypothetical protein
MIGGLFLFLIPYAITMAVIFWGVRKPGGYYSAYHWAIMKANRNQSSLNRLSFGQNRP